MDEKKLLNNWTYAGYVASIFTGNFVAPLTGGITKLLQDTNALEKNKTADYIRVGALAWATIDCVFGAAGTFNSTREFFETAGDLVTVVSLYSDLQNYSQVTDPIKNTFNDIKNYFRK